MELLKKNGYIGSKEQLDFVTRKHLSKDEGTWFTHSVLKKILLGRFPSSEWDSKTNLSTITGLM